VGEACARFFLYVVSLAASSTGRRVECEIDSLVELPNGSFNYLSADFDELQDIQGSSSVNVPMTAQGIRIERFADMLASSLTYEQV